MPDDVGHCSTLGYTRFGPLGLILSDADSIYVLFWSAQFHLQVVVMPQSLAQIIVHVVFSTKNREPLLPDNIRASLHEKIGGIIEDLDGTLLEAGSVADHIHLLLLHPRTCSPAKMVQEIKSRSSLWLKQQSDDLFGFHWQNGYGMFSISPGHRQIVGNYLRNQAEHHRSKSFQDEYRHLLKKYEVAYDERYVWD